MPLYYDVFRATTTNGSANTCSSHLRLLTAANQPLARVTMVAVGARPTNATAGAAECRIRTADAANAGGTSTTPNPKRKGATAASTTAFNDATGFTGGGVTVLTDRQQIDWAQTGGHNAWIATEPDDAFQLVPNAGANGNLEIASFATGTSQGVNITIDFNE